MFYHFELFTAQNIYDAAAFVRQHEYCCINLAEQLRLCLFPEYSVRYKKASLLYECTPQQKICHGVLLLNMHGMLLHCFDPAVPQEVIETFGKFFLCKDFVLKELYAVSGTEAETLVLERLINRITGAECAASFDYYLMCRTQPCGTFFFEAAEKNIGTAIRIIRADEQDIDTLFPLQLAYENEEVAYNGKPITPSVCRLALQVRLKQNCIYAVWIGTEAVAKAGTNAQGFDWFQLGGIYTRPEYRQKGLAAAVVAQLINTHIVAVRGFALFVKIENKAAIRLYTKLGFTPCSRRFRMSYR